MVRRPRPGPSQDDKLEALHYQLIEAVADLATSDGWARMLAAAARFHDYSPSNILLICAQRPDATRVGGIRTWNSLGRRVNKGEHGIAILAPCIYRAAPGKTTTADQRPESPSRALAPEPREPAAGTDRPPRQLRGFKVVHVFDVSQTDGDPLPDVEPAHLTGAGPDGLWDHLAGLVQNDGYGIERGPCGVGANGYTDFAARVVRVRADVDPAQAVKSLAHELGHIRADHEHRFTDYAASTACRGQAEVEAESIAYLITARAGLDSATYSVPYLASWSGGDVDLLRQSMTTVLTVARGATVDDLVSARPPAPRALPQDRHPGPTPTLLAAVPMAAR
ncbi:MAG: zinc-dependent metalloprotease [Actinomycetales bacterium]|nr:zinc-dependent metalloprotease [Actinomycetales bacterium]